MDCFPQYKVMILMRSLPDKMLKDKPQTRLLNLMDRLMDKSNNSQRMTLSNRTGFSTTWQLSLKNIRNGFPATLTITNLKWRSFKQNSNSSLTRQYSNRHTQLSHSLTLSTMSTSRTITPSNSRSKLMQTDNLLQVLIRPLRMPNRPKLKEIKVKLFQTKL